MIAGDSGQLFINQGWRNAKCLGVHGARALVRYWMPQGPDVLLDMPAEWVLKGRTSMGEGWGRQVRNISANRLPKRWVGVA
jgi:hypothetical protein